MSTYLLIKALCLPPNSLIALAAIGLLVGRWRRWLGRAMWGAALTLALAMCVPYVATKLTESLQTEAAIPPDALEIEADVVVVLTADLAADPPEWGIDQPSILSLERLRYGAALAKRTGLPLLLAGGVVRPDREALADRFSAFVEDELGVPVRFKENRSLSTRENARFTAELLDAELTPREGRAQHRVALVTHAWHMRRARAAFERAGLDVLPAPLAPLSAPRSVLEGVIPTARAFHRSTFAIHEWMGIAWYSISAR